MKYPRNSVRTARRYSQYSSFNERATPSFLDSELSVMIELNTRIIYPQKLFQSMLDSLMHPFLSSSLCH